MEFSLFVIAKERSEQLFTVRWRSRGAVGLQGDRNVGTLFCPALPRPAFRPSPCRPDLPVVCPGLDLTGSRKPPLGVRRFPEVFHKIILL